MPEQELDSSQVSSLPVDVCYLGSPHGVRSKGPCFGSVLIKAGAVSGGGNCQYTDDDGEMAVISWTADGMSADGRTQGTWEMVGGSGKWAVAAGGGRFDAGTDDKGVYTNNVTGELTMP